VPPPYVVAVDIGGTTIKSALVTEDLEQVDSARQATPRKQGPDSVLRAVLDAVTDAVASGSSRFGDPPRAVGLACLGAVDERRGIALGSGAIGWHDVPIRALVEQRSGLPVVLGHDLRAGGVAEARLGAGRGHDTALFVAIGTGIGAAIIFGGQSYPGSRWRAGELGHVVVKPGGYHCRCGGQGCLEAEASGTAIAHRYNMATDHNLSAREVFELHRGGDPVATEVWQTTISRLAVGLCTAIALLDPDIVVVGGGVGLAGDALFSPLQACMQSQFNLGALPPVVPAAFGDSAACLGAGLLALELAGLGGQQDSGTP